MRKKLCKILVTGGAGFIGSEFTRQAGAKNYEIIVIDKLTYAGDLQRLKQIKGKFKFYKADICNQGKMHSIFKVVSPEILVNFAAETHVDRSILDSAPFIKTNILGTKCLLDLSIKFKIKKFIQISSDEVYGEIKKGELLEDFPLRPNSPYAASKAAADLLVKAYIRTYDFPAIIVRPCNNYGPWQYPEKLIPLAILKILKNQRVPVYGKGENIREWLFVSDCAKAIMRVLERGSIGETYNIGSSHEKRNIDTVRQLLKFLGKPQSQIKFVADRPGHDLRYRLNCHKIKQETGWFPQVDFREGLNITLCWYLAHKNWLLSKG